MTATVIIITLERPDYVRRCLTRLAAQEPAPDQVVVVDASRDRRTAKVMEDFPDVIYLRNETGIGRMTTSRNIALRHATGNIIAFLDDDAFAHDGWLANLMDSYDDQTIGAVGGRALHGQPDEETSGVREIGRLKSNGMLTGNFAADPGEVIEVDHVMGCNMSFRREVLAQLGGFREDYPGISGVREDTDMCLRVRRAGYRILFNPRACVDHVAAPQAVGQRFDPRYLFFAYQNHCVMLARNYGPHAGRLWKYLLLASWQQIGEFAQRLAGATARLFAGLAGMCLGMCKGSMLWLRRGGNPVRRDSAAVEISAKLTAVAPRELAAPPAAPTR